jgi:hypothetical protein
MMTNRLLTVEFSALGLEDDDILADGSYRLNPATDYRIVRVPSGVNLAFVSEHKLDLSGYAMEDLTMYFRSSFEQRGGITSVIWQVDDPNFPLLSAEAVFTEMTILSSVPMSDDNLVGLIYTMPGFIPFNLAGIEPGNFNRTQIIHGSQLVWGVDSTFGGESFTANGFGYSRVIQANEFSSLEPTAADCIYCYRLIVLPESYTRTSERGLTSLLIPPKRVLLDATTDKEPDIEYLMRLKRSYELANQV